MRTGFDVDSQALTAIPAVLTYRKSITVWVSSPSGSQAGNISLIPRHAAAITDSFFITIPPNPSCNYEMGISTLSLFSLCLSVVNRISKSF